MNSTFAPLTCLIHIRMTCFLKAYTSALIIFFSLPAAKAQPGSGHAFNGANRIRAIAGGFILSQEGTTTNPEQQSDFAAFTDEPTAVVDHCWPRGGALSMPFVYSNEVWTGIE